MLDDSKNEVGQGNWGRPGKPEEPGRSRRETGRTKQNQEAPEKTKKSQKGAKKDQRATGNKGTREQPREPCWMWHGSQDNKLGPQKKVIAVIQGFRNLTNSCIFYVWLDF